ncbi:MAG TPA: phosphoserine transaminase [Beutenbergiaceae bacterium]|nr:phosphoserine transaminase [Beutenbergiaceae bacterium]
MSAPVVTVPAEMLPADGRFGSGPSRIRPAQSQTLAALGTTVMGTSHRQPPVRHLVARIKEGLSQLFDLPSGYEVVLGNGGTTTFWDVATFALIRHRSQHVEAGEFGAKFAAATAAAPFLDDPVVLRSEPGAVRSPEADERVDAYAWVQNETSTGVVAPVQRVDHDGALMLVDATSAAGAVPVNIEAADVYYFAPQKSFASDGGLWLALCSPAALDRADELRNRWTPPSLSLVEAVANSRKDQTLNTPAIATLILMAEQLDWLNERGGLSFAVERTRASAEHLYSWAEASSFATPFVSRAQDRSPVIGTIDFDPAVDAAAVAAVLRANGVVDVEPYRKLGRNQIRIGMYPAVDPADVAALTDCVDYVVARLG